MVATCAKEKILEMISDLQAKVIGEGNDAQKEYDEYAEFTMPQLIVQIIALMDPKKRTMLVADNDIDYM